MIASVCAPRSSPVLCWLGIGLVAASWLRAGAFGAARRLSEIGQSSLLAVNRAAVSELRVPL